MSEAIIQEKVNPKEEQAMPKKRHGATYYSVTELADELGIHRNSVIYWITTKQVSAVRFGLAEKSPYFIHEDEAQRVKEKYIDSV